MAYYASKMESLYLNAVAVIDREIEEKYPLLTIHDSIVSRGNI
jgi:hypothetical protein